MLWEKSVKYNFKQCRHTSACTIFTGLQTSKLCWKRENTGDQHFLVSNKVSTSVVTSIFSFSFNISNGWNSGSRGKRLTTVIKLIRGDKIMNRNDNHFEQKWQPFRTEMTTLLNRNDNHFEQKWQPFVYGRKLDEPATQWSRPLYVTDWSIKVGSDLLL